MGAVGGSTPFADAEAATLAGLTRSEVMVVDGRRGVTATTGAPELARAVARNLGPATETVAEISLAGGERLLVTAVALNHGRVVFVRDLGAELAILPDLQRTALASTVGALAFALLVGALFAHRLARPVAELADAAEGFAAGRPEAPLGRSALLEVRRLSEAFTAMRRTLAARLSDLERANRALEDRQRRLAALQAEVVQRERLATSGRLLAQLAHEIRNPVASVRNCLEIVRRQGNLRGEAREFAEMAVSELLRMHELAERMLDLHRPRAREAGVCDAGQVARDTVQLLTAGEPSRDGIDVVAAEGLEVRIAAEALKQVLLNLVLNAREAAPEGSTVEVVAIREHDDPQRIRVEVLDRGPGIPGHLMDRIFDPFFTTKDSVHGVGLGLYTAESLVRAAGGVLRASNRADGPGARFSVILPAAH
jgi:signal transduction histidine kinase